MSLHDLFFSKQGVRRFSGKVRSGATLFFIFSILVWSLGVPLGILLPKGVNAAVTEAQAAADQTAVTGVNRVKPNFGIVTVKFGLTANASEKLNSLTFTVTGVTGTGLTAAQASDFNGASLHRDTNNNDLFDDTALATGAVNVGSATTLTIAGGHTLPTAVNGSVEFYLTINAAVAAVDNRAFTVALASGTSTYVLDSGQVTATARTTQTIVIDSTAPTATNNGGPANNQTGVPVDAQIDRTFSENVLNTTVTTTTVTLKTNTGNAQGGAPTGSNLCLGAFVQQSTRVVCEHLSDMAPLSPSTWYTFQITTGLTDIAGNALAANYTVVFQTSSFQGGMGNNPPPTILGTVPAAGSTLPQNGKIMLSFSRTMNTSSGEGKVLDINNIQLFALTNGAPTGSNLFTSVTGWTYDTARNILTIASLPTLTAGNRYRLIVKGDNNTNAGDGSCGGLSEPGCVMSTDNLALPGPDFLVEFTGAANDTVLPRSLGSSPTNNATGVDRGIYDIAISFNEPIDPATVSTTTVKLYCNDTDTNAGNGCDATDGVTGTDVEITGTSVKIEADGRGIHLSPNAVLGNSGTPTDNFIVRVVSGGLGVGVKDLVGNSISLDGVSAADIIVKFSTSDLVNAQGTPTYDNTAPSLSFGNADNFGIFLTFSEPVKFNVTANATEVASTGANDINNPTNLIIETTTDGTTYSQVFITDQNGGLQSGKSISYAAYTKTLTIDGLSMPPGQQFRATVSANVWDLSGNTFSTTNNRAQGTVLDSQQTHGNMGPGPTTGPNFFTMGTRPNTVFPMTPVASATSSYSVQISPTQIIPASGRITLTFPTGFSFNTSCNTFPTTSMENADINGPGTGTVTVASIACDSVSRIATLTLGSTATVANDALRFVLQGIVNSSMPKDFSTSGYTVDIKTYNAATPPLLLDAMTSMPFFLSAPGTYSISGGIFVDNGAGTGGVANDKIQNGTEAGVQNIRVCLGGGASGFTCTSTDASGNYTFTQLNAGTYHIDVPPVTTGTVTGGPFFRDVNLTAANNPITGVNFPVQQASAAFILEVYVSGGTGLANQALDVFGFQSSTGTMSNTGPGPGGFVVRAVTLDGSGIGTAQLPLAQGNWQVGVGPALAKEPGQSFTMPVFNFAPPRPVEVPVGAGGVPDLCTSGPGAASKLCFTLTSTQHQIIGKIVDGSGAGIANVFVMARPAVFEATDSGMAFPTQTSTTGNFTLRVVPGTYVLDAFIPGMPPSNAFECTVKDNNSSTDNNTTADVNCNGVLIVNDVTGFNSASLTLSSVTDNDLVLKIAKGDTSVSGKVLDDNGTAIPYAHVSAQEVDSSGNPTGGWVDSPTDSSGNYTLYVAGGTTNAPKYWKIKAFAPGFGELATLTVAVVSGTNLTGKNLQATTGSFVSVSGTVYQDDNGDNIPGATEGIEGASVNIYGTNGGNTGVTGASGTFTLKVKSGTNYTIEGFVPGKGPTTRLTNQTLTSDVTGKNLKLATPGTLVVYVCTLTTPSAAPSATNGCASNQITNAFVDARDSSGRGYGTSSNTTAGKYELVLAGGTYTVCAGTPNTGPIGACQSATVTASTTVYKNFTPSTMYTVSGTLTSSDTACIEGATVSMADQTNGRFIMAEVASTGIWSTQVPSGSYTASAGKPGCIGSNELLVSVTTASVTGVALTIAKATLTLSGSVTLNGTNVTVDTMVSATNATSGKKIVVPVDTSQTTGVNYLMYLTAGTWAVLARGDGYQSSSTNVTITTVSVTQNLTLTAISGVTIKPPLPSSMTPSRGGVVTNTDIGTAFNVNIPSGALGSSTSEGSVSTKQTYAVADTKENNVVGDSGVEITSKDSSGQPIKTMSSSSGSGAQVTLPYTDSDVTSTGSTESKLMMATWSEEKGQWESLATTCDTTNNTCTGTTTHFSTFALVVASAGGAPSTPTGLAVSSVTTSQATLAWTQTSGATGYDIYRSTSSNGTFARVGSEPTVSSGSTLTYTDTGLSAGTNYYYKISALNASGESAASSAVLATTEALRVSQPTTGGGGTVTTTPTTTTTTVTTPTTQKETTKTTTPTTETSKTTSGDVTSSSGGTVALEKGEAKVEVPAGAVASTTKITITPTSTNTAAEGGGGGGAAALGSLPPDYSIVGSMYDFKGETSSGSAVTQFSKDLTIVFSFTKDQIAGLNNLAIHYYDEAAKKWIPVDSTVNESSMTVTATVNHFTLFALMGVEEAKAETTVVERLVKSVDNTAVYYVGANGKRYVFPNEHVYFSWYSDFKGVETITSAELAAFSMGGVITYRPGMKMLKIQTDPKVYAVGKGGVLRWIKNEATAKALYGDDWNKKVDDVNVAFWFSYKFGADINFVGDYDPSAETAAVPTINEDKDL